MRIPGARPFIVVTIKFDPAQQERDKLQRHRYQPKRRSQRRQVVNAIRRKRRIRCPRASKRAALYQKRRKQNQRAKQEYLVRKPIDSREHHVVAADHQRDQIISKGRYQHRHGYPENHDAAVNGHQRVIPVRRHQSVARHYVPGKRELHAENVCEISADQRQRRSSKQILHGNHFVIGRPQVLVEEAEFVMPRLVPVRTGVGVRASSGCCHRLTSAILVLSPASLWRGMNGVSLVGAALAASAGFVTRFIHAACCCGVSTIIRACHQPMAHAAHLCALYVERTCARGLEPSDDRSARNCILLQPEHRNGEAVQRVSRP